MIESWLIFNTKLKPWKNSNNYIKNLDRDMEEMNEIKRGMLQQKHKQIEASDELQEKDEVTK